MSRLAWMAITNYHGLGGLNYRNFYFPVPGAEKSKIKVSASSVCVVDTLRHFLMAAFSLRAHLAEGDHLSWVSSYKDPIHGVFTLMT